jgi:HlyD family secretion protein
MKTSLFTSLALAATLAGVGCEKSAPKARRGATRERLPRVLVVNPKMQPLARRLEVAATVEAMKSVDISARIPGIVRDLDDEMTIERVVKEGEILLKLDVPELVAEQATKSALAEQARKQEKLSEAALTVAEREVEESQSDKKKFEADVAYTKLRYESARQLVRDNAQNPQVALEALRQSESAQAAEASNRVKILTRMAKVGAAKADLELSRQKIRTAEAEVKKLDTLIEFATIRAPFSGVITRRWVDPGAIIKDSATTLFTVQQISRVRVLIDIPQRDVPLLNTRDNPNKDLKGDPVTIRLPALAAILGQSGVIEANVTRSSRALDPVTRTMRAEIELDNPQGYLRPGMYGSASVLIEDLPNVMTLPSTCLVRQGEGLVSVYRVVNPSYEGDELRGVLELVPVYLGIDDSKQVQLIPGPKGEKLRGDELIVERATGVMRAEETVLAIRSPNKE